MNGPICPSLTRLSRLLLSAHRVRERLGEPKPSIEAMLLAERDILRLNHLISRHRKYCNHCKARELGPMDTYGDST